MKGLRRFSMLIVWGVLFFNAGSSAEAQGISQEVSVRLTEWRITMDKALFKPGEIVFNTQNQGKHVHELVVIQTDLLADHFTVEGGRVKESKVGSVIGEIEGIPPRLGATLALNLSAGNYVLFCNNLEEGAILGHYQQGMRISFKVESSHE